MQRLTSSSQTVLARVFGEMKKAHMRSMVGLRLVAGDLRRKEMFVACNDLRLLLTVTTVTDLSGQIVEL